MLKKLGVLFISVGCFVIGPAQAHDFWIQPDRHVTESGETITLSAKVGHGEDQSAWPLQRSRVTSFRSIGPNGTQNHLANVPHVATDGRAATGPLSDGVHVIVLESNNSFSQLPAEKFASYVEEEGILPIASHRRSTNRQTQPGTELYSRRGKTLVQVGAPSGESDHLLKPVGATLEITPLQNPFGLATGSPFSVRVDYYGQPLKDATIHVTQLNQTDTTFTLKTGEQGVATAPSLPSGQWMFHTVWSEPASGLLKEADYLTVFSSLSFEIR